jgi:hypothetical protein
LLHACPSVTRLADDVGALRLEHRAQQLPIANGVIADEDPAAQGQAIIEK